MQRGISSHIFLPQRLTPGLLDALLRGGANVIEIFAARHHFDYADRSAVRELALWFRSNDVAASLHMPLFTPDEEADWSRHSAPTLNLIDARKPARIAAMDEVKRALEAAEQIPFRSCVLHLGLKGDPWNSRTLDDSLTSLEHLKAFAGPLGVALLLENLDNGVATPEHLVEIVRIGHFALLGFCLDVGHAHLAETLPETRDAPAKAGVTQAFETFSNLGAERIVEVHLHDNHGTQAGGAKDEHLWPGDGHIDWAAVQRCMAALPTPPAATLEIAYQFGENPALVTDRAKAAWDLLHLRMQQSLDNAAGA